jgi:hypothetical protein
MILCIEGNEGCIREEHEGQKHGKQASLNRRWPRIFKVLMDLVLWGTAF